MLVDHRQKGSENFVLSRAPRERTKFWMNMYNRPVSHFLGFLGGSVVKNLPANAGDTGGASLIPGLGWSPGERYGHPVFLPERFHEQRSLAGYSLWGRKESDTTEQLTLWPTPVSLPGESNRQRSLAGYSLWGRRELDMPERLTAPLQLLRGDGSWQPKDFIMI